MFVRTLETLTLHRQRVVRTRRTLEWGRRSQRTVMPDRTRPMVRRHVGRIRHLRSFLTIESWIAFRSNIRQTVRFTKVAFATRMTIVHVLAVRPVVESSGRTRTWSLCITRRTIESWRTYSSVAFVISGRRCSVRAVPAVETW